MIEGLTIKSISDKPHGELVDIEVVVTGIVTKEELESLKYCVENKYNIALYRTVRGKGGQYGHT